MSNMERNKGILFPTELADVLHEFPDADTDDLEWSTGGKYVRINGKYYIAEFDVRGDTEAPEFADVKVKRNGEIHFHTYHYNGSAGWTELVEENI